MSTPEDKVKQIQEINRLKELSKKNYRSLDEEDEYERLFKTHGENILKKKSSSEEDKPPQQYQVDTKKKGFNEDLLKDYEKETGKKPLEGKEGGVALAFDSREEAVKFFKGQAGKNRAFDAYNTSEDHRMYSDGKGLFVQGKKAEVDAYLKNPKAFDLDKESGKLTAKEPENTKTVSPT
ncbi:hypothetical protein [Legionella jamestowniensis]|uniref:Substrate of the Dot/Icm secretion system n=1 Tax=Legionella jamestowniensis TaxID=455 RepID=A0A0W0ULF2_9GAMM|nr:hypothetical protein [Legionella jamestowniensis]KTD08738.1 substrate of the Dot/Icm secretion system [Legionella jamestowniensis]OCH96824.1 hypothetical protein A8135_04060 [Legionella jamestowniensis]SFL55811.1 hypothetical protein SAMN02746073_0884 [Legionella jamestowniensis DSM 19215]